MNTSYLLKKNAPILIATIVLVCLVILVGFSLKVLLEDSDKLTSAEDETSKLRTKVNILKANKSISQDKIKIYNQILGQLVPEKEDFFSVIYALELLSKKTNFTITSYNINLSTSSKDKYSLTVQGDGDANTFLNFLKNYQYGGGRLITNEKIEFSSSDVGKIKVALNFYSKKLSQNIDSVVQISQKDLKLMEDIKNKTTVNIKTEDLNSEGYPTKSNPF